MQWFWAATVYVAFYAVIGFAVYTTQTGWPLFAILLMPRITIGRGCECEHEDKSD